MIYEYVTGDYEDGEWIEESLGVLSNKRLTSTEEIEEAEDE